MTSIDHQTDPNSNDDTEAGAGRAINRTWEQRHGTDDATVDGRDEVEASPFADRLADLIDPPGGDEDIPDEPGRDLPEPLEVPDNRDLPPELPGEMEPPPSQPGSPYMETVQDANADGAVPDDDAPDGFARSHSTPV